MALTSEQYNTYLLDAQGGAGFGQNRYNELRSLGATNRQMLDIAMAAPIIGPWAQEQLLANYDFGNTMAGMGKLEELQKLGAPEDKIIDLFSGLTVVGDRVADLYPQLSSWGRDIAPDMGRVPPGFDWTQYVSANPDLIAAGIDTGIEALRHYTQFGYKEPRPLSLGAQTITPPPAPTPTPPPPVAAPPAGTQNLSYDVSTGIGMGKLDDLLAQGATRNQIVDIGQSSPIVGTRLQTLFPELRNAGAEYAAPPGLTPEQLASYDLAGVGFRKLEELLDLGATPEQISQIISETPTVGTKVRTVFPMTRYSPSVPKFQYQGQPLSAGLAALAPPSPVSLVQTPAEQALLAPSVQTIGPGGVVLSAPVEGMKEGGLASIAQELASKGRGGDTMLAHINPEEAGILKALGGSGTINPKTGLPEFIKLFPKKGINLNLGPLGNIKFGKKSSDLIQAATAIYLGSYMPGGPGLSTAGSAAVYGGVRAAATGNLTEGIRAGLTAYGLASAYQGLGGSAPPGPSGSPAPIETRPIGPGSGGVKSGLVEAGTAPPPSVAAVPATVPSATGADMGFNIANAPGAGFSYPEGSFAYDAGGEFIPVSSDMGFNVAAPGAGFDQAIQDAVYGPGGTLGPGGLDSAITHPDFGSSLPISPEVATQSQLAAQERVLYNPLSDPEVVGESLADLSSPDVIQAVSPQNAAATAPDGYLAKTLPAGVQEYVPDFLLDASGTTLAAGAVLAPGLVSGAQERKAYARQQAALAAKEEEERRKYQELFASTLGQVPIRTGRQGGLMSLAKGGMTYMEAGGTTGLTGMPRDVKGTGDGMSDSVPATIEGVQEARLADGEFVIPADVVADIGNGSSNAGSKKLYNMMDRIRKSRHGTTKQPPEIDAEALMPA